MQNIKTKASKAALHITRKAAKIATDKLYKPSHDSNVVGVKRLNDGNFKLHWVRLRDDDPYRYHGQGGKLKYQITYSGFCEPPFFAYQLNKKGKELSCAEFDTLEKAAAYCDSLLLREIKNKGRL